ncbi:polysaccharide deacetylase family protein [Paenibacillus sp. CAA11]|uniref:polysaccharide deacetylase family protein n=1 Tax=Paenibacillus sp. CAA11 TaxID=1532905 RepID=UPI00131F13F7|nr:polysaccharide deacetylase family protein [Paenibacillus sp. CAA11]
MSQLQSNKKNKFWSLTKINTLLAATVIGLAAVSFFMKGEQPSSSSTSAETTASASAHTAGKQSVEVPELQSPSKKDHANTNVKAADADTASKQNAETKTAAAKAVPEANKKPASTSTPPAQNMKVVYLTFDDGPGPYTKQILNILEKEHIHATFFVIGSQLEENKANLQKVLDQGHYVGLHSMTHSYKKLYKSGSAAHFVHEFKEEQALFKKLTGITPTLIRAPYGSAPQIGSTFRGAISDAGFKMWDWTVDSKDWSYTGKPDKVIAQIRKQVHGKREVILMHEKKQTVQALPQIIAYLKKQGYSFAVYKPEQHFVLNFAKDPRL